MLHHLFLSMHTIMLAAIEMASSTQTLILGLIAVLVGTYSSKTFEWVQDKWVWLNNAKPLVRFIGSGLWAGLAGWLALAIGQQVPVDLGQMDVTQWAGLLNAFIAWAWHAFVKAKAASTT